MGPPIPRRSFDCGPLRGIVQDSISKSSSNHEKHGTSDQRDKIPSKTSPKIRMAGGPMGFDISPGTGNTRKDIKSTKQAGRCYKRENLYCERYSMHPGTSKLDCTMRSNSTAYSIYNKANPKDVQIPNIRLNMLDSKKPQNAPMRLDLRGTFPSSPRLPSSGYYCTNGRNIKRLGIPNKPTKILRKIRLHNELLHKRPRIDDSMVCPSNGVKEKCCDPSPMRQYNFNTSTKKGGSLNFQLATLAELIWRRAALLNWTLQVAHIGGAFNVLADQLSRNEALSTEWSLSQRFPSYPQIEPQGSSGLICYQSEQQTEDICQPMPRPTSNSGRCPDNRLGEVGTLVPLSPVPADFPGFREDQQNFLQECSLSHSGNTHETMVHGTQSPTNSLNSNGSTTPTSCSGQSNNSTTNYQTSRMAVVRTAYQSRFPSCNAALDLLAKPLRKSSLKDYEGKWLRFCSFLKEKNITPNNLNLAAVLEFFSYLFLKKNLRPGTVAHYRSALSHSVPRACIK